uniref:Uncharacterized protein n=1 Tax=Oryza glumipatula TaxID=40148 RepID=A0A0E0AVE0_9ORYZ
MAQCDIGVIWSVQNKSNGPLRRPTYSLRFHPNLCFLCRPTPKSRGSPQSCARARYRGGPNSAPEQSCWRSSNRAEVPIPLGVGLPAPGSATHQPPRPGPGRLPCRRHRIGGRQGAPRRDWGGRPAAARPGAEAPALPPEHQDFREEGCQSEPSICRGGLQVQVKDDGSHKERDVELQQYNIISDFTHLVTAPSCDDDILCDQDLF